MLSSKSDGLTHAQTAVPCSVCEDEVPGEYYCIECKQTLCPQCEKFHGRVTSSKDHKVVLRTQVGDIDTTILTCVDHGEIASCHCEKCDILVCMKCVTGKHQGHKMVDLNERLNREKELLQDEIYRIKNEVLPKLKEKGEGIKREKQKYESKIQQIRKDMEDEHQARLADLTKIHNDRMKSLDSVSVANLVKFDTCSNEVETKTSSCEERMSKSEDAIRKNNIASMVNLNEIKNPLPEIESTTILPDPPLLLPGNVDSIGDILGKLHVSSVPFVSKPPKLLAPTVISQFKSPLKGNQCIYITKEGDVWLGGNKSRELVMVDTRGKVLKRRKIQNRPEALAVMKGGDVIISPRQEDSTLISRLLIDGSEQHLYDVSPSYSHGVSITADQRILICTNDGRVVRINSDGTNVKQIYKGYGDNSAIHAIENSDGNIYVSDPTNSAVVVVSKGGKVLSRITHTTEGQHLEEPIGFAVDEMGNILCADILNHCVYIIDKDHQTKELVGPSHGIREPQLLALDKFYNLWIPQASRTVHVVKYLSQ